MFATIFWNAVGIIAGLLIAYGTYLTIERYKSFFTFFTIALSFLLFVNNFSIGASIFITSVAVFVLSVVFHSVFSPEEHRKWEEEAAARRKAYHNQVPDSQLQAMEAGRWAAFYMKH